MLPNLSSLTLTEVAYGSDTPPQTQPFNAVTWYDLLLRGDQINEFAAMTETELRLNLQ